MRRQPVSAEVLGHDRTMSAIIYANEAFICDFISDRVEAYRTLDDPFMLNDRFDQDPALAARAVEPVAP
jgi:hypothetical protein